ncbi:MAG: hypothetical protein K2Q09_08225 [Phycisphaerales bacterium]|nr:hypothetical protein [Phycisphaerales bacterium]
MPGSVMAGTGPAAAAGSKDWPSSGWYAQWSVFEVADVRPSPDEGREGGRDGESAWVQLPVEFSDGVRTHLRINFVFSGSAQAWIPVSSVVGNEGEVSRVLAL